MTVREIGIDFLDRFNRYGPLGAGLVGLTAYDALLPGPRPSAGRAARQFRAVARSAEAFAGLSEGVGAREILRLRSQARTALGDRFDLVGFHDQIRGAGIVPLSVLSALMTRWTAIR